MKPAVIIDCSITMAWCFADEATDETGRIQNDAAYVELAMRRRLPLASLDDDLRHVAIRLGVPVLGK